MTKEEQSNNAKPEKKKAKRKKTFNPKKIMVTLGAAGLVALGASIKKIPDWIDHWIGKEKPNQVQIQATNNHNGNNDINIYSPHSVVTINEPLQLSSQEPPFTKPLPAGISYKPLKDGFGPISIRSATPKLTKDYYCYASTKIKTFYDAVISDFALKQSFDLTPAEAYPVNWVFVDATVTNEFDKLSRDEQANIQMMLLHLTNIYKVTLKSQQMDNFAFLPTHTLQMFPAIGEQTYAAIKSKHIKTLDDAIKNMSVLREKLLINDSLFSAAHNWTNHYLSYASSDNTRFEVRMDPFGFTSNRTYRLILH